MGEDKPSDSTIYRLAKGTGFNARVEPITHNVTRLRKELGWIQYMKERSRVKKLVSRINDHLKSTGIDPGGWDTSQGKCIVNLRVEKLGVLEDLRGFVREDDGGLARRCGHLLNGRERNAYAIPVDFEQPFLLDQDGDRVPVGSSIRLKAELEGIEKTLHVADSLSPDKMVSFLHASETDISRYESKVLTDPLFWTKFGFVLLSKLVRSSVESGLPITFA